jgi:hypothetical protein
MGLAPDRHRADAPNNSRSSRLPMRRLGSGGSRSGSAAGLIVLVLRVGTVVNLTSSSMKGGAIRSR